MNLNDGRDPWDISDSKSYGRAPYDPEEYTPRGGRDPFSGKPGYQPDNSANERLISRRNLRRGANIVCGGLVLYLAVCVVVSMVMDICARFFPGFLNEMNWAVNAVAASVISIVSQMVPCFFIIRMLNVPARVTFPVRPPRLVWPGICCTLGMSIIGVYLSAIIGGLLQKNFGVTPTMPDFSAPYGLAPAIAYMVSLSIIPAILEELLFRGAVLQSLRPFGDGFALVVSSILFALLHGNLVQAPNAFVVGLVLGYFALRSGSVFTSIIMHFTNNVIAAVLSVLSLYLPERPLQLLSIAMLPAYLSLGIVGIVIMVSRHGGFIRPVNGETRLMGWEKYVNFFTTPFTLIFIAASVWLMANSVA